MNTDVQVQVSGDVSSIIDQAWQAIAPALIRAIEFGFTEGAIAGVLVTWALTHGVKLWIEAYRQPVTRNPAKWRFHAYGTGFAVGVLIGLAAWPWAGLPGFVAVTLSVIWWRVVVAIPCRRLRLILTTQTDRRLMGID